MANESPVRVLYLSLNPNLGASARTLQDWLLQARNHGVEAAVVLRQEGPLQRWLGANGVPCLLDPMPWPERWNPFPCLSHAWRVARFARRQGADIVHCYEHDLYPFACVLRRFLPRPLLCHVHFTVESEFARWAFGRPSRKPDALVWTTEQQKADCSQAMDGVLSPERQHIIPLGIDVNRFGATVDQRDAVRGAWGVGRDEIVVGAASALRGRKRVDDFLDLVRCLRSRHSTMVAVFAGGPVPGDEAYATQVEPKLRTLEAEGRFRWLGHLEQIEPFMHAIDVFVSTSEYETFGMSVCEALAAGRPVAAYHGGSVHEIVGDAGLVVPTGDLSALIDAVSRLVASPELRARLGAEARQRVKRHYESAIGFLQLKELYQSLLVRSHLGA